jgi:15-cis-phytoene synthase
MRKETSIFFRGSRTFFMSSLFFPGRLRSDIFDLYSFLRLVDDYVDQPVPDKENFNEIYKLWRGSSKLDPTPDKSDPVNLRVVKNMLRLSQKHDFDPAWIEAFFDSMQKDIKVKKYRTLDETLEYVYGSAEVVGLMMTRIMNLPPEADQFARLQGRAFQWINFIRDIDEDNKLSRQYFPAEDLKRFNLKDLSRETAQTQPKDFKKFMRFQLGRYRQWQNSAERGYSYISFRARRSILSAARAYNGTADQISANPLTVFGQKIKPSSYKIVWNFIKI